MNYWTFVTNVLCLLQICHPHQMRQNSNVHNQILGNSESGIGKRTLRRDNSLEQKLEPYDLNELKTEVKRSNVDGSPKNDFQDSYTNHHTEIKSVSESKNKQRKRDVGVMEHLSKETQFLRKKKIEESKNQNSDTQTERNNNKINDDYSTLDEEDDEADSPKNELKMASHLNQEEDVEMQQLENTYPYNQKEKPPKSNKNERSIHFYDIFEELKEPRLKRKKREVRNHEHKKSFNKDWQNNLRSFLQNDIKKRDTTDVDDINNDDKAINGDSDYKSDEYGNYDNVDHDGDDNGDEESDDDAEESDDDAEENDDDAEENDDDAEESDDDVEESDDDAEESDDDAEESDDDAEESDDDAEESDDDAEESDDDGNDATSDDESNSKANGTNDADNDDMESLTDLSNETQFLHKERPKSSSIRTKHQRKSNVRKNIVRLKAALHNLSGTTRKISNDVKLTEEMNDGPSEPKKTSNMLESYQEPYIPPVNTETSIVADAVLWIGVAVGTAFSAIMFILCCSFYKCLFYYRSHLSSPLKNFLESYDNKMQGNSKGTPNSTDEKNQYVISISDKDQNDLTWSSGEEEVFDVSTIKQSRNSSVKTSPEIKVED